MPLKVLIVDEHRLTLNGMRMALAGADDIDVLDALTSGADLLAALKRVTPDIVLLDADLSDMDGLRCLELLRENHPSVKVGVLFAERDTERIHHALSAGAAACVMKNVSPEDLPAAVRQVVEATVFTAAGAARAVPLQAPETLADLTDRERTMLKAIARGLSNKAISRELWVTEQTVKFHLNNVYRKLGVPNRTAAARFAFQSGLVDDGPLASSSLPASGGHSALPPIRP